MEKNGRASAGPRSKHIYIRHFWITDRLHQDNISLQHCPTAAMLADFLTKPLQGQLFRKFRAVLLGTSPISVLLPTDPESLSEERVGKTQEKVSLSDIARDGRSTNQDGGLPPTPSVESQKNTSWSDIVRTGRSMDQNGKIQKYKYFAAN